MQALFEHVLLLFDLTRHVLPDSCIIQVCTTWDYTPSREVTAMVYPLFEFSLILYLVLDFITVALYYQKGWISKLYFKTSQALFVITIILASWFRMIFVFIAYEDTQFHTLAFVGEATLL